MQNYTNLKNIIPPLDSDINTVQEGMGVLLGLWCAQQISTADNFFSSWLEQPYIAAHRPKNTLHFAGIILSSTSSDKY